MASHNITHKYLLSILDYNQDTGVFTWCERPLEHFKRPQDCRMWNTRFAGKKAGSLDSKGHIQIEINYKSILAHILAYFYIYKKWPTKDVDHYDKNRSNNAIKNLREATESQNIANSKVRKDNTSGYKGVYFYKASKKWKAQIQANKIKIHLGYFNTPQEAHAAYCKAAQELFGEFASFD